MSAASTFQTTRGTIRYVNSPEHLAKELRPAIAEANKAAVREWHARFLPRHFTRAGARMYGYQPRKGQSEPAIIQRENGGTRPNPAYYWRKRRRVRHSKPLVLSGESLRRIRAQIRVSGSSKQARGRVYPPSYFWMYRNRTGGGFVDKGNELFAIVQQEANALARGHHDEVGRLLRSMHRTQTKRV